MDWFSGRPGMEDTQELTDSIVHRFLTVLRFQHRSSALIQQKVQIPGRQVAVLRFLIESGPSTVTQVSRFLYVREATASTMLERMEQSGFVTRNRSAEDNRKVIVEPTVLGTEVVLHAPLGMVALLRERLPKQPLEDLKAIEKALAILSRLGDVDESLLD
ncbi:MAG: MarR family transcriptional regulator [Lysobacterales bacterium]|nr:MAG: MarR family transcriptional regulator [Xanthomonadales bacterium]